MTRNQASLRENMEDSRDDNDDNLSRDWLFYLGLLKKLCSLAPYLSWKRILFDFYFSMEIYRGFSLGQSRPRTVEQFTATKNLFYRDKQVICDLNLFH